MERERLRAAGALGNAPLLALSSFSPRTFPYARNNRLAAAQRSWCSQCRFPNLPYSRSPESAGREAALEVGLETCAAWGQAVRSYSQL